MSKEKKIIPINREGLKKIQSMEERKADKHYKKMVEEELALIKREQGNQTTPDEFLPPVNMEDSYGNLTPHILINKRYIPKPLADVIIQEKRVVLEYQQLDKVKKEAEAYKRIGKESLKLRKLKK